MTFFELALQIFVHGSQKLFISYEPRKMK